MNQQPARPPRTRALTISATGTTPTTATAAANRVLQLWQQYNPEATIAHTHTSSYYESAARKADARHGIALTYTWSDPQADADDDADTGYSNAHGADADDESAEGFERSTRQFWRDPDAIAQSYATLNT